VHFVNVTNFAILASRSTRIRMDRIEIADSGRAIRTSAITRRVEF